MEDPNDNFEDIDLSTRLSRNPLLWFGLILVPVVFGLLVAFVNGDAVEPVVTPSVPHVQAGGAIQPAYSGPSTNMGRRLLRQPVSQMPVSCDFQFWIGQPVNEMVIRQQMDALRRPYRILPSGAMRSMDYQAARVNFELDERNLIKHVFCG